MAAAAPPSKRGRRDDRGASGRRPATGTSGSGGRDSSVSGSRTDVVYGRNAVARGHRGRSPPGQTCVGAGGRGRARSRTRGVPVGGPGLQDGPAADACFSPRTSPLRAGSSDHQGIVVETDPYPYTPTEAALSGHDLLIALDRIQDPHNLGSIIRTAEEVGGRSGDPAAPHRHSDGRRRQGFRGGHRARYRGAGAQP